MAAVAVPGAADARTDTDPCPSGAYGVYNSGKLACDGTEDVAAGGALILGPPSEQYGNLDDLPVGEELKCSPGDRIPGTDTWGYAFSYNWDWDYYVKGGSWVLWDGRIPYVWPKDGDVSGGNAGYNAFNATVDNWGTGDPIATRLFWRCETPGSSRAAARPETGDAGDDSLAGDEGENALIGMAGDDRLHGHAGDDHLHGGAGNDALFGGVHDDLIHGRRAADKAVGGNGEDDILTGRGHDIARGGPDGDQLFDDEGRDTLRGGAGNDRFSARDGDRDVIRCGRGRDIAIIDELDVATGANTVPERAAETPLAAPEDLGPAEAGPRSSRGRTRRRCRSRRRTPSGAPRGARGRGRPATSCPGRRRRR